MSKFFPSFVFFVKESNTICENLNQLKFDDPRKINLYLELESKQIQESIVNLGFIVFDGTKKCKIGEKKGKSINKWEFSKKKCKF